MVVLANENLLLNFHPPLCQVLELKEMIVGIVYVFRKMNYRWSKTDKVNLCQAGVLLIELPLSSVLAVLLHTVPVRSLDTPSPFPQMRKCVQTSDRHCIYLSPHHTTDNNRISMYSIHILIFKVIKPLGLLTFNLAVMSVITTRNLNSLHTSTSLMLENTLTHMFC